MYEISYNDEDATLFYKVCGFWLLAQLRLFQEDLNACVVSAKKAHPNFKILSDSTEFPVQSADVADEMKTMMLIGVKITGGRKAFVVSSVLMKKQYERTIGHPTVGFFSTMDEARGWLAQEG